MTKGMTAVESAIGHFWALYNHELFMEALIREDIEKRKNDLTRTGPAASYGDGYDQGSATSHRMAAQTIYQEAMDFWLAQDVEKHRRGLRRFERRLERRYA